MLGDMGHTFFYLLAEVALLVLHPILQRLGTDLGQMGSAVFGFRWLPLSAALCAFYCGALCNECFGLPFLIGGTGSIERNSEVDGNQIVNWTREAFIARKFGMDPVWVFKDNELIFLNNFNEGRGCHRYVPDDLRDVLAIDQAYPPQGLARDLRRMAARDALPNPLHRLFGGHHHYQVVSSFPGKSELSA
jgi:hypothetical protein